MTFEFWNGDVHMSMVNKGLFLKRGSGFIEIACKIFQNKELDGDRSLDTCAVAPGGKATGRIGGP